MNKVLSKIISTPLGRMRLSASREGLTELDFWNGCESYEENGEDKTMDLKETEQINRILKKAEIQLKEYFDGKRRVFRLPLAPEGTDFQLNVWRELQKIPYGETRTYSEIAAAIGKPKAQRAVGGANNKNPLSIVIPCHRVIGKNGALVGYASGLDIKEKLLEFEKQEN